MKKKNIAIIILLIAMIGILAILGIRLLGAPATSQKETLDLIQRNEQIEIEIAIPENVEQGTENKLTWTILAELDTYQDTLRTPMEESLNIKVNAETGEKTGQFYQKADGTIVQNNTLRGVMENQLAKQKLGHDTVIEALSDAACGTYADLETDDTMTNFYMALNGYFNLLPDAQPNYCNPNSTLSRAELMAMIMRADTPVDTNLTVDSSFESVVGKSELNLYAQVIDKDAYLNTSDSSLNEKTYTGTISRAEAIYLLVNHYYGDAFKNFDMSSSDVEFADAKDGGDIATEQGFADKNYSKSYELIYSINNPDGGLPTDLYKALVFARTKGIIDEDTRWDEGLTKAEAVELLIETMNTAIEGSAQSQDSQENNEEDLLIELLPGEESLDEIDFGYESEEEYLADLEDGIQGGTVVTTATGESYVIWDSTGDIYYPGDTLPGGVVYGGNSIDRAIREKEAIEKIKDALYGN